LRTDAPAVSSEVLVVESAGDEPGDRQRWSVDPAISRGACHVQCSTPPRAIELLIVCKAIQGYNDPVQ